MIDTAAVRHALSGRFTARRFSPRTRRFRTLGAAGFAGVSVSLLAAELPASSSSHHLPPVPRFAANALVGGLLAVPVRFDDAASAAFLKPGDHIDVLAIQDRDSPLTTVPDELAPPRREESRPRDQAAVDVRVLAVPPVRDTPADGGIRGGNPAHTTSGVDGLVLLAVDNATAARLAIAAARGRLSYALRPGPG